MSDDIAKLTAQVSAKDNTPGLQVNHLSVAFHIDEGRVPAVSDVSFSIALGRITALVGESGSGKSVTSLALMRLLPGSTHQTGSRQTVTGSARFIARFIARQGRAVDLLSELRERLHQTLPFISHDLDVVAYLCDRMVVLCLGRVKEVSPSAALFEAPLHAYTRALLAASPKPDPRMPLQPVVLQGDIPSPIDTPSGCVFRTRCPQAQAACAERLPTLEERAPGRWVACLRKDLA